MLIQLCTVGRLAQLVERLVYTEDVAGSSPSPPIFLLVPYFFKKQPDLPPNRNFRQWNIFQLKVEKAP